MFAMNLAPLFAYTRFYLHMQYLSQIDF